MTHGTIANTADHSGATEIVHRDLVSSFVQMAAGITRPASIRWRLDDAARGRPVKPLGAFPEVAEECIDAGGTFHNISRPLSVMLAHLRRRMNHRSQKSLKDALMDVKRENDGTEAMALSFAFSGELPSVSVLSSLDRELSEEIQAALQAKELVEDALEAQCQR